MAGFGLDASSVRSLERLELVSDFKEGNATRVIQTILRTVSECPGIQSIRFTGHGSGSDSEVAQVEVPLFGTCRCKHPHLEHP